MINNRARSDKVFLVRAADSGEGAPAGDWPEAEGVSIKMSLGVDPDGLKGEGWSVGGIFDGSIAAYGLFHGRKLLILARSRTLTDSYVDFTFDF